VTFSFDTLSNRLREMAFLNRGLKITIEDEREDRKNSFHYNGGIIEFVKHINQNKTPIHSKVLFFEGAKGDIQVEVAPAVQRRLPGERLHFANNINTREGGTHLSGFRASLTRTIGNYAQANGYLKTFKGGITGDDVREGLTAAVSVRLPEPQFEGQTKTRLATLRSRARWSRSSAKTLPSTSRSIPPTGSGSSRSASQQPEPGKQRARRATW